LILGAGGSLTTTQGPPRKLRLAKSVSVSVPVGEAQDDERRPGRRRMAADLICLWLWRDGLAGWHHWEGLIACRRSNAIQRSAASIVSSNDARIKHHSHAVSWRTRGEGGHKKKSGRAGHALAESHAVVHLHLPFTLVHPGGMQEVGIHGGCGLRVEPLDLSGQQIPRRLTRGTTYGAPGVPRVHRDEEEGQVGQQTETPPCWLDLSPSPAWLPVHGFLCNSTTVPNRETR
jgi:hypothetical protein